MTNALYYGDNLAVLRDSIATESIDLIYLDPPFNSNASYNVLFKAPSGDQSQAQIEAFEDTWHWTTEGSERAFDEVISGPHSDASIMLKAMRSALGENDMMAYLAMMAVRLIELHRVLKPTGSLYLHCDPTASHYLKILLDSIFGPMQFRNEIVWQRTSSHNDPKRYGRIHDTILYYSRSDQPIWNQSFEKPDEDFFDSHDFETDEAGRMYRKRDLTAPYRGGPSGQYEWKGKPPPKGRMWSYTLENMVRLENEGRIVLTKTGMPRLKIFVEDLKGLPLQDVWAKPELWLNAAAQERLGYPTQKPLALLERIVSASSNEGDLVLDPFCGCGTTVHAAQKLGRQWIGIDVTHLAIALVERRLKEAFPGISFDVHGVPTDQAGARDLADRDKHQFQMWITAKVGAQPYKGGKKGMDRGIDGYLHFRDADKKPQFAIVSVKGGENITSGMVRDLKGTMDRENAALGLFLTLNEPTREMEKEAASAGFYETGNKKFPRLQILTAAQILDDRRPQVPFGFTEGFKKAEREDSDAKDQGQLI
jgi:site-specific DNA-methyltransferase (adenine-specific)